MSRFLPLRFLVLLPLSMYRFLPVLLITLFSSGILNPPGIAICLIMNLSFNITHCSPLRHYSFSETLGAGNFAKVKLATHLLTDEPVAVKIITHGKPGTFNDISHISREVRIMQQLHHPNIVQLYEVDIT